jgi:hypothetical protein
MPVVHPESASMPMALISGKVPCRRACSPSSRARKSSSRRAARGRVPAQDDGTRVNVPSPRISRFSTSTSTALPSAPSMNVMPAVATADSPSVT